MSERVRSEVSTPELDYEWFEVELPDDMFASGYRAQVAEFTWLAVAQSNESDDCPEGSYVWVILWGHEELAVGYAANPELAARQAEKELKKLAFEWECDTLRPPPKELHSVGVKEMIEQIINQSTGKWGLVSCPSHP